MAELQGDLLGSDGVPPYRYVVTVEMDDFEQLERDMAGEEMQRLLSELHRFAARSGAPEEEDYEERSGAFQRFQREVLLTERAERLRNEGLINDEAMHRIERDLDLEESRLEL